MSIFNVNWRSVFLLAQPPSKRAADTLDLGESLLTTLEEDSDNLAEQADVLDLAKKYNGTKIVFQAALNEIMGRNDIVVETNKSVAEAFYFFTQPEAEPVYEYRQDELIATFYYNTIETSQGASIIVTINGPLTVAETDTLTFWVETIKVAGKSYIINIL